jgi:ubiquinone/menaquinone biosynthesis C-methylase UbiE
VGDDGEQATSRGYDLWAPLYDDGDPSTWLDEPFLLEWLTPFPDCRILDLGCGTGRYLRRLSSNRYRVVAVDLSRGMLARARRAAGDHQTMHFLQASVTCLPFRPGCFDRIMSGLVLDHVASPEDLFRQMITVLAPNGRAVIAGVHPDLQRLTGADIEVASDEGAARIQGRIHEVTEVVEAARRAHFKVEALQEPLVTPAMVERRPAWKCRLGCPALLLLALAN